MSAGVISPKLIWSRAGPTHVDPREVKPLVSGVKPAGDSTPARPEMAARHGKRPQGTDEAVLGLIGELLQARVEWW